MFDSTNPVAGVDLAFWYIFGFSAVLLTGITILMIVFVVKYRRSKHPKSSDIRDNWKLEVIWTVIPTLIALTMFAYGWSAYTGLRNVPEDAEEIEVIGQMFSWIFIYPNDKETENELVVPAGRPIRLSMESIDVIHSFFIPAFRVKTDVVNGITTHTWFHPDKPGTYDIMCTEFCGVGHADMNAILRVLPPDEYDVWLEEEEDE